MYQETMAANAAVPQNGTQTSFAMEEPAADAPGGAAAGQNSTAPMQETAADSADTTRAFSERLKAVSSRKVDEFIAGMGLRDAAGTPIRTRAQYDSWQAAQSVPLAQLADPALREQTDGELRQLRSELAGFRDAERDRALLADPEQGETYARLRDKVQQLRQSCRECGTDAGLDAVYAAVLLREAPGLCRDAAETARSEALRGVQAAAQASPGALGDAGAPQTLDFESMSSRDFAEYRRRALRGDWE